MSDQPWEIEDSRPGGELCLARPFPDCRAVAYVETEDWTAEEADRHARLLVKAPELADCLIEMLFALRRAQARLGGEWAELPAEKHALRVLEESGIVEAIRP